MELVRLLSQGRSGGDDLIAPPTEIEQILTAIRSHLGMDVAFVSHFVDGERVFRYVDGATPLVALQVGDSGPLEDSYCQRIVDGRLPQLMPDTSRVAEARAMPVTAAMPVGSHLSVPLVFSDGTVYGTFCCFSHASDASLNERDLGVMRAFAEITAAQLEKSEAMQLRKAEKAARIRRVLDAGGPAILYQPIIMLEDRRVVGVEALSRFHDTPLRTPDQWFAEAAEVGLQVELELAAMRNAIEGWRPVWRDLPFQLGLNCSPATVVGGRLAELFADVPADRIVIELTEHDEVDDYFVLNEALKPLRALGVKIAIDDTGSGYASMRHILTTRPNIIKLDISLTKSIDSDPMRRALAEALIGFARGFNGRVVAEGIETEAELLLLRSIGAQAGQGYHIARPMSVPDFRRFLFQR